MKNKERQYKIQDIKKRLMLQRQHLLSEEGIVTSLGNESSYAELGDQSSAETDRNFVLRLKEREQKLFKKIDDIIESINKDTYGICKGCKQEISIQRLEARPVTDMCIDCKKEEENEEENYKI